MLRSLLSPSRARTAAVSLLALLALISLSATAQMSSGGSTSLLHEVHTLATATTGVPVEHPISIANAGTYQITLTDLGAANTPTPAPLASVKLALTSGDAVVGTPLTKAGVLTFTATAAGDYLIHVVGAPGTQAGSGPIGIAVGTAAAPASLYSFSDNITLPGQALPNGEAVINDSFTVSASGSYTVTLTDFQLPQALSQQIVIVIPAGATTPTAVLPDPVTSATTATVNLTQGVNYRIVGGALPGTSGGGLFGATVAQASSAPVYSKIIPVGTTVQVGAPTLTAGPHTATLSDLAYPAALAQLSGVLTLNGQSVASLSAGTPQTFTAQAATYQAFVAASAAAASPGAGSYFVGVSASGAAPELSVARVVTASGSAVAPFSFATSIASAGSYTVTLTNFSFPASLSSARLAVVQGGALLGTPLTAAGGLSITASPGPITFLVLAQADPKLGGLFDVSLTANGSSALLFDATQGVTGTSFSFIARSVKIATSGNYLVHTTDVGFPANFTNFATLVSQGGTTLGSIFGSDQLAVTASPGNYFVNVIAQPASADNAGTYALDVSPAPVPTVTLSASSTQVTSGGTVTLTWSSTNATACTASGGWSGTQSTSGQAPTSSLTADTTFTLTCTGTGGSATASATVNVAQPTGKSGGGSLDAFLLALLAGAVGVHARRAMSVR